jgi:chaperone modulatory protein CbpM
MAEQDPVALSGLILEEELELGLDELCGICGVEHQHVVALVEEGVLEMRSQTEWRFGGEAVRRVRTAMRLQRDLGVNVAGIALALELMDRIAELERRLPR